MPDWLAIEAAYREGAYSLRTIAAAHGITEGAIRARAKKGEWLRKPLRKPLRKYSTQQTAQKLTEAQHAYVSELAVDGNPYNAAKRAGYPQASPRVADLRNNDAVQAAAIERIEAVAERCGLTSELVMRSIVRELKFDPANVFNEDGSLKPIHEIDQETRMALQVVETTRAGGGDSPTQVCKVKWATANQAREQAMKHLGLFLIDNRQRTDQAVVTDLEIARRIAYTLQRGLIASQQAALLPPEDDACDLV